MLRKQNKFLIFLGTFSVVLAIFNKSRYVIDMEGGSVCPDNNQLEIPLRKYKVDRINRTHKALSIDFSFAHPLDKDVEGNILIERWANGKWINIPIFHYQNDPCRKIMDSNIKPAIDLFVDFMKAAGVKYPETCDIPAGNYSVNNYIVDITSDIPFWIGRFRSKMILRRVRNKKKIFCCDNMYSLSEL